MNYRGVWFLLGRLMLVLTLAMLVPAAVGYAMGGDDGQALLISAAVAGAVGLALQRLCRQPPDFRFGRREAFVLVSAAWVVASIVGALPYVLVEGPRFAVNALFESASGFTTTGATIYAEIGRIPPGLLLWRSLTQWLGGMGIIVLGIAILPKLAVGGMELLGAEAPGPIQEKLTPRIAQTAKALWGIYALLTLVEALVLIALGMTPFEGINHALTTMATGGFSTRDASIGGFDSAAIEMVITLFMLLAGANFALHFQWLRGRPGPLLRDAEFRCFLGILGIATVLLAADLIGKNVVDNPLDALRLGAFQSTTIVTTTGYTTANFDAWPSFARALLFFLMFIGGCAGSTGGSVKVVRVMIVAKTLAITLKRLIQPNAVLPVRIGPRAIPEDVVNKVTTFFLLFLALFATGGLLLAMLGLDPISAFSASASCLGNIGPGFGVVGAAQTYAPLPWASKLILAAQMIVGRLELYTVMVLLFLGRRGLR